MPNYEERCDSVLQLIKDERAFIKLIKTIVGANEENKHINFIFQQLEHPAKKRPVKNLDLTNIDRSRFYNTYEKVWLTKNKMAKTRGTPKPRGYPYTKKEAVSLLPRDGVMKPYLNKTCIGLLLDSEQCLLKKYSDGKVKYVYPDNVATNSRFWLKRINRRANQPAIPDEWSLDELKQYNKTDYRTRNLKHNEILAGLSKEALKAIFVVNNNIGDRLLLIYKKEYLYKNYPFIKNKFDLDMPMLIINDKGPPSVYDYQTQLRDFISGYLAHSSTFRSEIIDLVDPGFFFAQLFSATSVGEQQIINEVIYSNEDLNSLRKFCNNRYLWVAQNDTIKYLKWFEKSLISGNEEELIKELSHSDETPINYVAQNCTTNYYFLLNKLYKKNDQLFKLILEAKFSCGTNALYWLAEKEPPLYIQLLKDLYKDKNNLATMVTISLFYNDRVNYLKNLISTALSAKHQSNISSTIWLYWNDFSSYKYFLRQALNEGDLPNVKYLITAHHKDIYIFNILVKKLGESEEELELLKGLLNFLAKNKEYTRFMLKTLHKKIQLSKESIFNMIKLQPRLYNLLFEHLHKTTYSIKEYMQLKCNDQIPAIIHINPFNLKIIEPFLAAEKPSFIINLLTDIKKANNTKGLPLSAVILKKKLEFIPVSNAAKILQCYIKPNWRIKMLFRTHIQYVKTVLSDIKHCNIVNLEELFDKFKGLKFNKNGSELLNKINTIASINNTQFNPIDILPEVKNSVIIN